MVIKFKATNELLESVLRGSGVDLTHMGNLVATRTIVRCNSLRIEQSGPFEIKATFSQGGKDMFTQSQKVDFSNGDVLTLTFDVDLEVTVDN